MIPVPNNKWKFLNLTKKLKAELGDPEDEFYYKVLKETFGVEKSNELAFNDRIIFARLIYQEIINRLHARLSVD